MDTINLLMQFNLTRQEASLYFVLLSKAAVSGYEAAKTTGISRSNAYMSLAALVDKGAAYVIEGATALYSAVPVNEFCGNIIRRLEEGKNRLVENIPLKRDETEGYITIRGDNHIINKMRNMILQTHERVYLSISRQVLDKILSELEEALRRGIKIVLITDEAFNLNGATVYHMDKVRQQIRLISDSTNVLTGDIGDGEYSACLFSKKKNLVDLIKDSLKNEIKLIEMMKGNVKL